MSTAITTRDILLSKTDAARLDNVVRSPRYQADRATLSDLQRGLQRGRVLPPPEIPRTVVTMRSRVRIEDLETAEQSVFTLVYPEEANLFEDLLSVLAPLGTALLGARTGDVLEVQVPRGMRRIKVQKILYQPEAAGHFDR